MRFALLTAASALALAAAASAEESRELGAHLHGHGALNIAFEGGAVVMEFEAPGADIVGFEHPAESAEDRAAIDAAVAALAKPLDLFVLPAAAGCAVTAANVALITEGDDHDDHGDEHAKDEHGHDDEHAKDEHGHEDEHAKDEHGHDDHDDDEHAKDEHGHDDHDEEEHAEEEEGHTEFHAEYGLTCADPSKIVSVDFAYFAQFPNAEELEIQLISAKGAKGFEVERDEPSLDLSGAI